MDTLNWQDCELIHTLSREGVDNMTIRIRIGLVAVVVTYIATILSILLGCMPMHKNWQIFPDPGSGWRFSYSVFARASKADFI